MTGDSGPRGPRPRFLRGIGIDAEQVSRFEKLAAGSRPWRHVYSPREGAHLVVQPRAALAFCASFCCKEALCKALGGSVVFPDVEVLYRPGAPEQELVFAPGFAERHGIAEAQVVFDEQFLDERGECLVEVRLYHGGVGGDSAPSPTVRAAAATVGKGISRLETLLVAAVAAGRREIQERYFASSELVDLGRRRVQSLAGFLALKRALSARWADAGAATGAAPRDFVLAHHESGAPRLVAAPSGVAVEDVFVSISHTRQWAYGLAAIGETAGRP